MPYGHMVGEMSQGSSDLMRTWVVQRGATVCAKECSWLTNRASEGPHFEDAKYLRVSPSRVTVDTMNNFRIDDLTKRYNRVTPNLQAFLQIIIGKQDQLRHEQSQNPNHIGPWVSVSFVQLLETETFSRAKQWSHLCF
jgi:hypothetical protein